MQQIMVQLGTRSYPISIGSDLLPMLEFHLQAFLTDDLFLITNTTVSDLYLSAVQKALAPGRRVATFVMQDNERHKNFATFKQATDALVETGFGRDSTVVALGGGVVGDLAGFVAATYQRGVRFVQIPTTLLAQVDSSVGGKTAINHELGKNLIGAFHQPAAVIVDTTCLQTLPEREYKAGLAEVIKYGVIADAQFFSWLEANLNELLALKPDAVEHAIATSCAIKAHIVAADEREKGQRALLNFGHTFGHAIEAACGYGNWLHGEAVAAGMAIASDVAKRSGLISREEYQRVIRLLSAVGLPVQGPAEMDWQQWQQLMARDKKVEAGKIRYILPTSIGAAQLVTDVDLSILQRCVAERRSA